MNEQQVTDILNYASDKLENHPEYESWMRFSGADIRPDGVIMPLFVTKDGKSGFSEPKLPVYQQVWNETVEELGL